MQKTLINSPAEVRPAPCQPGLSDEVSHLLSRTLIGISPDQRKKFAGKKRKEVLDSLFSQDTSLESLPLKDYDAIQSNNPDQKIAIGQTWVYDFNHDIHINDKRKLSLKNWVTGLLYIENSLSVAPRMFLFWSNFFGLETKKITFTSRAFQHFNIIRKNCLGNYVELLTKVVTDPAFLNYYQKIAPKGKKIYEFTAEQILGRYILGPRAAENISKEKKKRLIRLLNKWFVLSDLAFLHDRSSPTDQSIPEPSRFIEAFLDRSEAREIKNEIEYVFRTLIDQPASAEFLTERLYQFFLGGPVDEEARDQIIVPVAKEFARNGYDIQPWIYAFLSNRYFYDKRFVGRLIKSPMDYVFSFCKSVDIFRMEEQVTRNYFFLDWLRHKCAVQGQDFCDPPDNSGWLAILDNNYHQSWITDGMIYERRKLVNWLLGGETFPGNPKPETRLLQFAKKCVRPTDPHLLVHFIAGELFVRKIPERFLNALARTFLNDGPVSWSHLWNMALECKNQEAEISLRNKLSSLIRYLLFTPEINFY